MRPLAMKPFVRAVALVAAVALPLGGCVNFDPTEWLAGDWFNNKKPLPGERRELFPGGVPGVSKGVPPDLIKGNQEAALQEQEAAPVMQLPEEPKAKPKAKPKPKPKVVQQTAEPERRPTAVTVRPPSQPAQAPAAQWPDPPPPRAQPQPQSGVQWPDPPAPR